MLPFDTATNQQQLDEAQPVPIQVAREGMHPIQHHQQQQQLSLLGLPVEAPNTLDMLPTMPGQGVQYQSVPILHSSMVMVPQQAQHAVHAMQQTMPQLGDLGATHQLQQGQQTQAATQVMHALQQANEAMQAVHAAQLAQRVEQQVQAAQAVQQQIHAAQAVTATSSGMLLSVPSFPLSMTQQPAQQAQAAPALQVSVLGVGDGARLGASPSPQGGGA